MTETVLYDALEKNEFLELLPVIKIPLTIITGVLVLLGLLILCRLFWLKRRRLTYVRKQYLKKRFILISITVIIGIASSWLVLITIACYSSSGITTTSAECQDILDSGEYQTVSGKADITDTYYARSCGYVIQFTLNGLDFSINGSEQDASEEMAEAIRQAKTVTVKYYVVHGITADANAVLYLAVNSSDANSESTQNSV